TGGITVQRLAAFAGGMAVHTPARVTQIVSIDTIRRTGGGIGNTVHAGTGCAGGGTPNPVVGPCGGGIGSIDADAGRTHRFAPDTCRWTGVGGVFAKYAGAVAAHLAIDAKRGA